MPSARQSYILLDAIFDKTFSSPLALPDLPYQGAIRLHNISHHIPNQEVLSEHTVEPHGPNETIPDDIGLPKPTHENITADNKHLGRPLRLKKCLYGANFSGKSWYETLDDFLQNNLKF